MKEIIETVLLDGTETITVEKFFATKSFVVEVKNGALDDKLIRLTDLYREIFAFEPWNEYLKCRDHSCTGKMGTSEVSASQGQQLPSGLHLSELEKGGFLAPDAVSCPKCGSKMEPFYPPDSTLHRFRVEFQKNITGVLLWDERRSLSGFTFGWITNYRELWEEKLEKACAGKLSYTEYANLLAKAGKDIDRPVFYLAEWGLDRRFRGSGAAGLLLGKLRDVSVFHLTDWVETTDVVNYSRTGSKPHLLMDALGSTRLYDNGDVLLASILTTTLLEGLNFIITHMMPQPNAKTQTN
jgi:hypothetical protein